MRRIGARLAATLSAALLIGLLAIPASAAATTGEPIAQTGGMSATLPLLGASLTVDVTLDATGNITGVALTPTGVVSQTKADATFVKFANAAGTTTVSVKAKGDRLSISAKSASLADLLGSGTWSADVFGTGAASSVAYTVGNDGTGNPTIALGTITPAATVTATAGTPKSESEDGESSASVRVVFARDGFIKVLKISVSVDLTDGHAGLKITLTGKDRQKTTGTLAELSLVPVRTWSAHLCDGTAVSVTYHVAADGTIVYDGATGGTTTVKTREHGISVRFDGTKVGVSISLRTNEDGTYTLVAKGTSGRCDSTGSHDGSSGSDSSSAHDGTSHDGSSGDGSSGTGSSGSGDGSGDGGDH